MKKKGALLALSLTLALSVTACGSSSSDSSGLSTEAETEDNETVAESETEEAETETADNDITFEGLTVVDNDECSIEISAVDADSSGDQLDVVLENKSSEKTYMFSIQSISVNGLEISDLFANEVAPGKKANDTINLTDSSTEKAGITENTDVKITFRVYDSNDWMADPVALETVHVYLYGEDKAAPYVRESESTDIELVDNDNITVTVTGYEEDSILGFGVDLYLVNKTDKEVMFATEDESVNGFMVSPAFATTVSERNSKYSAIYWSNSNLEENGIETVEEIEFTLRAYDSNDILGDEFVNEVFTLNP